MKSKLIWLTIFLVAAYIIYKNISSSVFFQGKDRINVVFYSDRTNYYSLGLNDVSYIVPFPASMEVTVPGGYGKYRIGALGKLVLLEKKPDILRRTLTAATFSFADLYFYPKTDEIYYSDIEQSRVLPVWTEILLSTSNANPVDRFLLLLQFIRANSKQFVIIDNLPYETVAGRKLFDDNAFNKKYQGAFYKKTYRNIKDNVQLLYTKSYKTALMLSRIIEGEGIRVVDLSQITNYQLPITKCLITANKNKINSLTVNNLQRFFGCQKKIGRPTVSDIIITLGSLEEEWAVN